MKLPLLAVLFHAVSANRWYRFSDSEYFVSFGEPLVAYDDAVTACASMNANLALVKSQQVLDFLKKIIIESRASLDQHYIGLRNVKGTQFVWNDGTTLQPGEALWDAVSHRRNFASVFNCASINEYIIRDLRGWNPISCTYPSRYICQRPGKRQKALNYIAALKKITHKEQIARNSKTDTATQDMQTAINLNKAGDDVFPAVYVIFGILILVVPLMTALSIHISNNRKRASKEQEKSWHNNETSIGGDVVKNHFLGDAEYDVSYTGSTGQGIVEGAADVINIDEFKCIDYTGNTKFNCVVSLKPGTDTNIYKEIDELRRNDMDLLTS